MGRSLSTSGSEYFQYFNPIAATDQFGYGRIQAFLNSGTFTVPEGITKVRVRLWGGGGATATANATGGGTSSFGAYVSATGGQGGTVVNTDKIGGNGVGGDINHKGGDSGFNSGVGKGGGGAASIFGDGGNVSSTTTTNTVKALGGGAGGNSNSTPTYFAGQDGYTGKGGAAQQPGTDEGYGYAFNFLDFIATGGGGGGGNSNGINGGGGGVLQGLGGWPGGGAGGTSASSNAGGAGGGFALKVITGLTPGDTIPVTVGEGGNGSTAGVITGGKGLVIVEY